MTLLCGVDEVTNVITFNGKTLADTTPNSVLKNAPDDLKYVLVIGLDKDGKPYYASSESDLCKAVYWGEKFKQFALYDDETDLNT